MLAIDDVALRDIGEASVQCRGVAAPFVGRVHRDQFEAGHLAAQHRMRRAKRHRRDGCPS